MKRLIILLVFIGLISCQPAKKRHEHNVLATDTLIQYVNPIIGTNGMGHTFPRACAPFGIVQLSHRMHALIAFEFLCAPFGIVQLSPDTDTIPHNVDERYQPRVYEYCAGYQHKDSTIVGFSHTHFSGTGHSDLGDVLVMPTTGNIKLNPGTQTRPDGGYRSRYRHATEKASPGYYEVVLDDYDIKARLTATEHVECISTFFPQRPTATSSSISPMPSTATTVRCFGPTSALKTTLC